MLKNKLLKMPLLLLLIATFFISTFGSMPSMAIQNDNNISLNMRDADIRDVLSALAVNMGKSIIYTPEPINVTLSIDDVDSKTALTYLLSSYSMDYLEDNNSLIIGFRETLTSEFYNKLSLSKFSLKYITSDILSQQLDALQIPVKKVVLDSNKKVIWLQGLPKDLTKANELISMLDRAENLSEETYIYSAILTPIHLTYITAEEMNNVLGRIGLNTGMIIDSNPMTLWVYGSKSQITEIQNLQKSIDITENALSDNIIISAVKMTYLTTDEIIPILNRLAVNVNVVTFERSLQTVWLNGTNESVKLATDIIKKFDIEKHKNDDIFFVYKTVNITAQELKNRFDNLDLYNVTMETLNYPEFSKSVLIFCPSDFRLFVMNHINKLDILTEKIKVPVDYSDVSGGSSKLKKRRDLLVDLTGIPSSSFTISENVSRNDEPLYIMYIEETQENIKRVKDYVTYIDDALSDGSGN